MLNRVRSVQLVWFLPAEPPPPHAIFPAITGTEPDAYQKIMPPQAPFPVMVQSVMIADIQHRVQSHIGRIDYFIEGTSNQPGIPLLENHDKLLNQLQTAVTRMKDVAGPITRMAVVLSLAEQVGDQAELASYFDALFSGRMNLQDFRDLSFQLSSRAEINGWQVNRLLRWTGENVVLQQFVGGPTQNALLATIDQYYMNYMIDVNTVPLEGTLFEPAKHESVFASLVQVVRGLSKIDRIEDIG